MKTEIENIIYNYADEIPHILIRVINAITLSDNKEELKTAINKIAKETELDKYFAYGYGRITFGSNTANYLMESQRNTDYQRLNFKIMKKKAYRVRTQYIFDGVFDVVAENKEDARQKVLQNCGLVMGGSIHSTLPDDEINFSSNALNNSWTFDKHPNTRIDRITKV